MPWAPLAGPLTTQGLHGARLRQAHSPRPYSVARHAVAAVTATHHPQRTGVASPAVAARPCHSLQSPRRLQPQEVYEMQHPRSPRQHDAVAAPRRFQPVVVAPPRDAPRPAERPPLPPPQAAVEVARTPNVPPLAQGPSTLVPGTELQVGFMRLRCEEMLGSGSYSTVWLANVVSQSQRQEQQPVKSVALKDVFCRGEAALQQSLFEVQLLMAVERRMNRSKEPHPPPRLPRCLTYQVDPSDEGWSVRMALTRLKGEQLDGWLQRSCEISDDSMLQRPWKDQLKGGCVLARHLLEQLGPTLQNLAPLAWHRDVNSHNVLICNEASEDGTLHAKGEELKASFWLCDLGLAVDSQSWTSEESLWRTTDIGGDCRYWPASCWMVHCFGADYLEERPNLCRQYQSRLDIHALGITAIEILCTGALALRTAGAPAGDAAACWSELLDAWKEYHETVSDWWQAIYSVFSCGGDFRPVHAWLVEIGAPDKILGLVGAMRKALNACADVSDSSTANLLRAVAEATHEDSTMDLLEICNMASAAPEEPYVNKAGAGPMAQTSLKSVQSVKSNEAPSSMGAADVAAGTQEPLPGVTMEDEKKMQRSDIHREASAPPAPGLLNRSTQLLKTKLEEEHSRLSSELQKLQKHRSRVLLAKTLLQQLPAS